MEMQPQCSLQIQRYHSSKAFKTCEYSFWIFSSSFAVFTIICLIPRGAMRGAAFLYINGYYRDTLQLWRLGLFLTKSTGCSRLIHHAHHNVFTLARSTRAYSFTSRHTFCRTRSVRANSEQLCRHQENTREYVAKQEHQEHTVYKYYRIDKIKQRQT